MPPRAALRPKPPALRAAACAASAPQAAGPAALCARPSPQAAAEAAACASRAPQAAARASAGALPPSVPRSAASADPRTAASRPKPLAAAFPAALAALLLAACQLSPEAAADHCEARARAANGPTGEVYAGISNTGPRVGGEIGISSDWLLRRDPYILYDQCVRARSGQGPIRPLDLTP